MGETFQKICHKNNGDDDVDTWPLSSALALYTYRVSGKEGQEIGSDPMLRGAHDRLPTAWAVWCVQYRKPQSIRTGGREAAVMGKADRTERTGSRGPGWKLRPDMGAVLTAASVSSRARRKKEEQRSLSCLTRKKGSQGGRVFLEAAEGRVR